MSEEVKAPEQPKPKQFLLMVDEIGMAFMSKVMPNITFVEIQGMNMQGNDGFQFLVNPIPKPVVAPVEGVKPEEPPVA